MHQHMTGKTVLLFERDTPYQHAGFQRRRSSEVSPPHLLKLHPQAKKPAFRARPLLISFSCQGLDRENYPDRLEFARPTQTSEFTHEWRWKEKKVQLTNDYHRVRATHRDCVGLSD